MLYIMPLIRTTAQSSRHGCSFCRYSNDNDKDNNNDNHLFHDNQSKPVPERQSTLDFFLQQQVVTGALTLLVGLLACKKLGVGVVTFDWSLARLIAPVVTTTSIILSTIKLANPGSPGKWP